MAEDKAPRVTIVIEKGLVQNVTLNGKTVQAEVINYDVSEAGYSTDAEGRPYFGYLTW